MTGDSLMPDWLEYHATVNSSRLAITMGDIRWTFAQLQREVSRIAGALAARPIRPGQRVAFLMAPCPETAALVHALTRIQAVVVPINTRLSPAEIAMVFKDADPSLLITGPDMRARLPVGTPCPVVDIATLWAEAADPVHTGLVDLNRLHALVYTSGTTGRPKGVEITLGNQWWSAIGFGLHAGLSSEDRWLHVMPLFHVGGLTILFRSVIHGSSVVMLPRFEPEEVLDVITRDRITLLSLAPTMLHRLLNQSDDPFPSHLRLVLLGGGPAPKTLVDRAHSRNLPVVQTYGLTETCSQFATLSLNDLPAKLGSSGHALLPNQLALLTDSGLTREPGVEGEILVQGPSVSRGYWRNPTATRDTRWGAWFRTGDIGVLDQDGYLTVLDRQQDLIVSGGENIYPSEIEGHLLTHPAIEDVAVFGVPDDEWGQLVAAAVILQSPVSVDEMTRYLESHVARYKIPKRYYAVTAIPRTASGKLQRQKLWQRIQEMAPMI